MKKMVWVYISNRGDGSCGLSFFSTRKKAENYAEHDDERSCDDIFDIDLNDLDIDPVHYKDEENERG